MLKQTRFWRITGQIIALSLVIIVLFIITQNLGQNLNRLGLKLSLNFLGSQASFDIGETLIPYHPSHSYLQAIWVGFLNTLRVIFWGFILSTLLGFIIGIARLSDNWLVRHFALIYVELIRNTPLLLQLFFLYFAVFLALPKIDQTLGENQLIYFTNRGIAWVWFTPNSSTLTWLILLIIGGFIGLGIWRFYPKKRRAISLIGLSFITLGWVLSGQFPLHLDFPHITPNLQLEGGLKISPEFATLLTGLSLYSASFIAEIVRAGIQSVPQGQIEAAKSLGFNRQLMIKLIILPQALRVIIPPLSSQYMNLAKNSSLAIAIGYPDLYFVASTTFNQTGRAVEVMLLIMITYLTLSLLISLVMNFYNKQRISVDH